MKHLAFILAATIASLASTATAQTAWNETAFTNKTSSGFSQTFRNVNQASHWLFFCAGFGVTGGTIEIDGSADQTNWITISNVGQLVANGCGIIQAGGYYPYVSAQIKGFTGAAPGVNATYTASVGPIGLPANAGFAITTSPETMVPATPDTFPTVKSAGVQISALAHVVLYGATVSNPNTGTVYVAFGTTSTPFVGGGSGVLMIPVAAGTTITAFLPPQGAAFPGGLWVGCSTSPTSAADPASNCVISTIFKTSSVSAVPN